MNWDYAIIPSGDNVGFCIKDINEHDTEGFFLVGVGEGGIGLQLDCNGG